jgi:peptide/nickel transport system permease protein
MITSEISIPASSWRVGRRSGAARLTIQIGRRLAQALVVLWGVTLITFVVARVLPGNPAYLLAGSNANKQTIVAMKHRLGLDRSVVVQYGIYMKGLVRGDLGESFTTSDPVTKDLGAKLPATLELGIVALLIAIVISLPLGIAAARRPRGLAARITDLLSAGGVALPQFWLGLMLIYFFFYKLAWAPPPIGRTAGETPHHITGFLLIDSLLAGSLTDFRHALGALVLPAITLAVTVQPPLLQLVRVTMREALASDAVRTARAAGLSFHQVVYRDALRLALLPILNMIGLLIGVVLSSSVLVETVFSWPGIGQYAFQAINASDYAAVQGVVLVATLVYVGVYALLDIAQLLIDPRLRAA